MNVGTLTLEMAANVARLSRDMDAARRTVQKTFGSIEQDVNRLKNILGGLGGALAAAFSGRAIIETIDAYTKYTAQIKLATKSTEDFANAQLYVKAISQESQASIATVGQLYARITQSTEQLGVSQERVAAITRVVALSMKVSGATAAESSSAMLQLSQAFASGQLRGEEFNAVNEAAPRLMRALADGIGVPVGKLREMAKEGQITSGIMADVLPKALAQLELEAKSIQTISGAFQAFKNEVMLFVGATAQANGVTSAFAKVLGDLTQIMKALSGATGDASKQSEAMKIIAEALSITFETIAVIGVNVAYVIEQIINEIIGLSRQVKAVASLNFEEASRIRQEMVAAAEAARAQVDATTERILNARKLLGQTFPVATEEELALRKTMNLMDGYKAKAAANTEEAKKFMTALGNLRAKIIGEVAGVEADFYKNMELLRQGFKQGKMSFEEYLSLAERYIKQQKFFQDEQKRLNDLYEDYAKANEDLAEAIEKERLEKQKQIDAAKDLIKEIEFEAMALHMTNEEREVAIKLRELERLGIEKGTAAYEEYGVKLRQAVMDKAAIEKSIEQQKAYAREWEKITGQIGQALTNALLEGGKNAKDLLKDLFKTLILRPMLQPIISAVTGAMGAPGAGQVGGITNSPISAVTAINSMVSFFKGEFGAKLGAQLGANVNEIGMVIAKSSNQTLSQFGSTLQKYSADIGKFAGALGNAFAGYNIQKMISGGYQIGDGKIVDALTAVGSAFFGPAAGVVGGIVNRAFGEKFKDSGISGTFGGSAGFKGSNFIATEGGWFSSGDTKSVPMAEKAQVAFAQQFQAMQASTLSSAAALGAVADSVMNFTQKVRIATNGLNEQQIQTKIAGVFEGIGESMARMALMDIARPMLMAEQEAQAEAAAQTAGTLAAAKIKGNTAKAQAQRQLAYDTAAQKAYNEAIKITAAEFDAFMNQFRKAGETYAEMLQRLSSSVVAVNQVLSTFGMGKFENGLRGGSMASSLIDAFGGLENFAQSTTAFYQNLFSEEERIAIASKQLQQSFASLGITIPKTREAYRALTLAQDLTTERGRQMFSSLVQLSSAFVSVTSAVDDQSEALATLKNAWMAITDAIQQEISRIRTSMGIGRNMNYAQAQAAFATATAQARAGDQTAAKSLVTLSQEVLNMAESQAASSTDLLRVQGQISASLSATLSELNTKFDLGIPGYASGTEYVPETGLALLHKGEAVIPASMNRGGNGDAELAAEIRQLRTENAAQARAMVSLQQRMTKLLEQWDGDGLPEERVVA